MGKGWVSCTQDTATQIWNEHKHNIEIKEAAAWNHMQE